MLSLEEYYQNSLVREKQKINIIKTNPNHNILNIASGLREITGTKFLYQYYINNNLIGGKQELFNSGKLLEFINKHSGFKYFPTQINSFFFILSDSREVLENFKAIILDELGSNSFRITNGHCLGYVIHQILSNNSQEALKYLDIFEKKHKNYALKSKHILILKAIINSNKQEVEELLEFFLLPVNHNKSPDKGMISHKFISIEATVLAKLAWIKGIEVDIDHPLLPKQLLPIQPNDTYEIEYEFLKADYEPNIKTKKEVPKPNAKYKKHPPKNKIEVTKAIIEQLIIDNWDATYTQKELKDNVDLIYLAFTNPQEFDKTHYDFAKLGNYHISHQNKDKIYIEKQPFTNMFTNFKDEIDYFFDMVNVCFDIMGIQLLDGKQYEVLKNQLEQNRDNNRGFFGKLFKN
nr:Imm49 family immunity protein [uncultured Psychroserpens sp.]